MTEPNNKNLQALFLFFRIVLGYWHPIAADEIAID